MPAPPCAKPLASTASTPMLAHMSFTTWISSAVSVGKWLMATTALMPNLAVFSMWRIRLAMPLVTRSTEASFTSLMGAPPW